MTTTARPSRRSLFGLTDRTTVTHAPATQDTPGLVAVVSEVCIETAGTACRACESVCDTDAIRFRPRLGGGSTLTITDACTGCGACPERCPVGAISMQPRAKQGAAP